MATGLFLLMEREEKNVRKGGTHNENAILCVKKYCLNLSVKISNSRKEKK